MPARPSRGGVPTAAPPWDPYDRDCPSRGMLDDIANRWAVLVIGALGDGPLRYSALAERVDGVSQKMLTQTLRTLERDGLVARVAYAEAPPRVEYRLTELGHGLLRQVIGLQDWLIGTATDVAEARDRYDAGRGRTADSPASSCP